MRNYRYISGGHNAARNIWLRVSFVIIVGFSLFSFFTSCGAPSGRFRIEGRLHNINQGVFYVYSPDGGIEGLDTIHVADGRFAYEASLVDDATFIIVFPNYSEHVVFGRSGATAKISGDVSHLKELEVNGTEENEQMTELRRLFANQTPKEQKKHVLKFINDNPSSIISFYLIDKYLLQADKPDYKETYALVGKLAKKVPDNARLMKLHQQLGALKHIADSTRLPDFTATDIKGKPVNLFSLKSELNAVLFWATWNSESYGMISNMQKLKKEYGSRLSILSVCMDPEKGECSRRAERDSLDWVTVCDEKMWKSPLVEKFAVVDIPCYILADKSGRVIARNLPLHKLSEKIEETLGKKEED